MRSLLLTSIAVALSWAVPATAKSASANVHPWTAQDLQRVAKAATEAARVSSSTDTQARMLVQLAGALQKAQAADLAKLAIEEAADVPSQSQDFALATTRTQIIEGLVRL